MITLNIFLFLISSVGLLLFFFKNIPQKILHILVALGAGSMFSVSLVHILPEVLENHELGLYAFIGGFLLIYIIEEFLTPHHHDHTHHNHSHEDPHEHIQHIAIISWIAIFVHTILDGIGIRAGFALGENLGMSILFGVAIHQIPVSLSLASLMRESRIKKGTQILLVTLFALSAPLGFFISDIFITQVTPLTISILTALAGGSLLYVSTVELLPIIHAGSTKHMKYLTASLFVLGVIGMSIAASGEHEHYHGHTNNLDENHEHKEVKHYEDKEYHEEENDDHHDHE